MHIKEVPNFWIPHIGHTYPVDIFYCLTLRTVKHGWSTYRFSMNFPLT